MSKYTPGPWILNSEKSSVWKGERIIAAITLGRPKTGADARLIAAAPELLAELRAARDYLSCIPESTAGGDDDAGRLVKRIDALIAKATGEPT